VYEAARQRQSQRWSRKTRDWTLEPVVWLNPERKSGSSEIAESSTEIGKAA